MKYNLIVATLLTISSFGCKAAESNFTIIKNDTTMITKEKNAIQQLLNAYESALVNSDTEAVLKLYADNGVFMPSEAPTSIGHEQVRAAYNHVFSQIKLNIKFSTDEIEVYDDIAFARTISKGNTDILAAGITVPEENRELFVLKMEKGEWKIARYIFNKMSPPNQ